ncbi:MAG: ribulose-phosphate 3-epimerase [Candidatus Staskawiczbacteria bacterium]|nr:ribulose-phosphate 3-epimerase [Candidatus Staskawiczbacteria bacterium]
MSKIIPAILTKNIADLKNKLKQVQGLTDWVQIDIMDGVFVDNTSVTLEDIANLELARNVSIEIHLMVLHPETYFLKCQKADIKRVIFHIEAAADVKNVLVQARKFDFKIGLALNPKTPVKEIVPYLSQIDMALLMSVNPGLQGQKFIPETLNRIQGLRELAPQLTIEVDGGINLDAIKSVNTAGADYLVVGSSLFENENIPKRFKELSQVAG